MRSHAERGHEEIRKKLPFTPCLKLDINGHHPQGSFGVRHTPRDYFVLRVTGAEVGLIIDTHLKKPAFGAHSCCALSQVGLFVLLPRGSGRTADSHIGSNPLPGLLSRMYVNVHFPLGGER